MKKSPLRIVIGIIITLILLLSGIKELRSSMGEVKTSIENLKEDLRETKDEK